MIAGLKLSSDAQCAFLMQDREARIDHDESDIHTICDRMYCKSPTLAGYYAAGPALEGTRCSMSDEKMVRVVKSIWVGVQNCL